MGGSVFLSHASEDKLRIVSLGLIQALQRKGLTVIVDRRESFVGLSQESMRALGSIGLGEMWRRDLPRLLEKADVVIACWSKNYVSRFTPDQSKPSDGQYIRDETEDARAGEYLVHVILDPVGSFPSPYVTLQDTQYLQLFKIEGDDVAKESGYDDLAKKIANIIDWRRAKELGSLYEARARAAIRLLDRREQEEPLLPKTVQAAMPRLFILYGPQVEVPEQLYNRFCHFTLPASCEHEGVRSWIDIVKDYLSGALPLKPWQKPPVVLWPQVTIDTTSGSPGYDAALRRIADQLYLAVPRIDDYLNINEDPLRNVLNSIKKSGQRVGMSYFAYSFISAERWKDEHTTICAMIERLGIELTSNPVNNFLFLIVIERKQLKPGLLRRLLRWTEAEIELGKKEGGPSESFNGQLAWYRLPDLKPVQKDDFYAWALPLADAWGLEIEATQSLLSDFSERSTPFSEAADKLILARRAPHGLGQNAATRNRRHFPQFIGRAGRGPLLSGLQFRFDGVRRGGQTNVAAYDGQRYSLGCQREPRRPPRCCGLLGWHDPVASCGRWRRVAGAAGAAQQG